MILTGQSRGWIAVSVVTAASLFAAGTASAYVPAKKKPTFWQSITVEEEADEEAAAPDESPSPTPSPSKNPYRNQTKSKKQNKANKKNKQAIADQQAAAAPAVPAVSFWTAATTPPPPPQAEEDKPKLDIHSLGEWALVMLRQGGWPVTGENVCALQGWAVREGGHFVNNAFGNPLNTTQNAPGAFSINSVGVKGYPSWEIGIEAAIKTINLGAYAGVRAAMMSGNNAVAVAAAVKQSPWGTKSGDPASWISGRCLAWAPGFDAKTKPAREAVEKSTAALETSQAELDAAMTAHAALELQFAQMAKQTGKAQKTLNGFARDMYLSGVDPAAAGQVSIIFANDPLEFLQSQQEAGTVTDQRAMKMQRAIELLESVDAKRQLSISEVGRATTAVAISQAALDSAQKKLESYDKLAAEM